VLLHGPSHDRKAEPDAPQLRGEHGVEHLRQVLRRDSFTGIGEDHCHAVRGRQRPHGEPAAVGHSLDGVGDDVEEGALQALGVADKRRQVGGRFARDADVRGDLRARQRLVDDHVQAGRRQQDLRRESEFEDVVDRSPRALDLAADNHGMFERPGIADSRPITEEVGGVADGAQRVPHLMPERCRHALQCVDRGPQFSRARLLLVQSPLAFLCFLVLGDVLNCPHAPDLSAIGGQNRSGMQTHPANSLVPRLQTELQHVLLS